VEQGQFLMAFDRRVIAEAAKVGEGAVHKRFERRAISGVEAQSPASNPIAVEEGPRTFVRI
jgi:hypothetical protein